MNDELRNLRTDQGDGPLGIVLAGGMSRRMGGKEKTLMQLGGKPLLAHVLDRLCPQVSGVAVNANGNPGRFRQFGVKVIDDGDDERRGPLAGVLAGMRLARQMGRLQVVTVAGDTPFFPRNLVENFLRAADLQLSPVVLAASRDPEGRLRMHPTFGLWNAELQEDLENALADGTRKILDWTDTHWTVPAEFSSRSGDPFFNINTPGDMAEAERRLETVA